MDANLSEIFGPAGTTGGQEQTNDQGQAALRTVQAMITEAVRTAVADASRELMRTVDEKLASVTPASTTSSGTLPTSRRPISLPTGGQMPSPAAMQGISVATAVPTSLPSPP